MELYGDEWVRKGATLSDKTARAEFGLTQNEIIAAIRAGQLQYRPAEMHGNPWLRLLRREVEDLVSIRHGERYLRACACHERGEPTGPSDTVRMMAISSAPATARKHRLAAFGSAAMCGTEPEFTDIDPAP